MITPGRRGQAGAAARRAGTIRVPAVPVAGGMPTPNPPFRPGPLLSQGLRTWLAQGLRTCNLTDELGGRFGFVRAADCLLMVVGHGYQEDRNPSTCPTISRMTVTLLTS